MAAGKPKSKKIAQAAPVGLVALDELTRAVDAFFDEMLVERWRCGAALDFDDARLINHPDRYEIYIAVHGIDPATIEVEARGQRLTVRASAENAARLESTFTFFDPVDSSAATAQWSHGTLTITVPKHTAHKVALKAD